MLPMQNPIIKQNIPIEINSGDVYKSISLIFVYWFSIIYIANLCSKYTNVPANIKLDIANNIRFFILL